MKALLLFLVMISQASCSELRLKRKHNGIDPEFKPYVQEFIYASRGKVTEKDMKEVSMGFHTYKDGSSVVGTCYPMGILTEIDIGKEWWDRNQSSMARQGLIFHELGHCVLKRNHTEVSETSDGVWGWFERMMFKIGIFKEKGKLSDGCPSSIMHPYVYGEECMMKHYLYYLDELFTEISYDKYMKENSHKQYVMVSCKVPTIINKTKTWTKRDKDTLERAKKTCINRYKSCLKTFSKVEEHAYRVLCL